MKSATQLKHEFDKWIETLDINPYVVTLTLDAARKQYVTIPVDEANVPEIEIGGTKFNYCIQHVTGLPNGDRRFLFEYQSDEPILVGYDMWDQEEKIYPLLDINIKVHQTRGGKVKLTLIRDGYFKTKLQ